MAFMNVFRRFLFAAAAVALTVALVGPAHAARPNGYPITNVNLRAGPGTDYPVILTVPSRAPISIRGCLPDYTWCDVVFEQNRGWMRSIYLAGWLGGQYYLLRHYAPQLRYPVVSFEIGSYWDSYYRDRPFYGERPRWSRPRGEGWIDRGIFYNRLAPYGQWVWLQGQYVWVPTRVGPSWRPYTYGRWVYTERYGWMWASDEPWGWATYHYGRWGFSNRIGWFWVPGSRWGPAWVSWRSSGDYLAWAPLPPAHDEGLSIEISIGNVPDYYWQVVPAGAFLSVNLSQVIVRDRARIRPVIEHARPLGNVTVVNNVVVNKLVNVKYVEEKTKKKVVVHKVERTKDAAKAGKVEGDAVEVFEPVAGQEPEAAAPPEPKKIEEVAAESKDMKLVARAKYNLGNTFFGQGMKQRDSNLQKALEDLQTSIGYWRQTLDIEPENQNAARNIEVARLIIKDIIDQINKQKEEQDQQQQDQQQQDQQQQDQQQQGQDPNQPDSQQQPQEQQDTDPDEEKQEEKQEEHRMQPRRKSWIMSSVRRKRDRFCKARAGKRSKKIGSMKAIVKHILVAFLLAPAITSQTAAKHAP